jgi:hypothetical protein
MSSTKTNDQSTQLYFIGTTLRVTDRSIHRQVYTDFKYISKFYSHLFGSNVIVYNIILSVAFACKFNLVCVHLMMDQVIRNMQFGPEKNVVLLTDYLLFSSEQTKLTGNKYLKYLNPLKLSVYCIYTYRKFLHCVLMFGISLCYLHLYR